ncbi:MAG: hypothetical protein ACJ72W_13575 [Actinoallomurus sp.]
MKELTALGCTAVLVGGVAVLALSLTRPCPTARWSSGAPTAKKTPGPPVERSRRPSPTARTAPRYAAHGLAAIRDLLRHSTARSRRPGSEVTR